MRPSSPLGSFLIGMGMFFLLWQLAAWLVDRPILPTPVEVVPLFVRSMTGELGLHFMASAGRVLAAILFAVATAVPSGLALGQLPTLNRLFSPLIAILYPIPKIVLLPVIYVLMGITDLSKIFLIALIIFFQIMVVVRDEAAGLHHDPLPVCLSAGIAAGRTDRPAGFHRHGGGCSLHCRAVVDDLGSGLLYRRGNLPGAALPPDVRRYPRYERPWAAALFRRLRIGAQNQPSPSSRGRQDPMTLPNRYEKATVVRSMFARIAARYDLMNRLMTFGQDRVWQREVVRRAALRPGGRLLDIGCGTGGIAKTAGDDPSLKITAADFTFEMLQRGRTSPPARRLEWCCADALALPFADGTFDAVTSGYLLRNVVAIDCALAEQIRVAKPGARIVCLDTAPPERHILRPLVNFHLHHVIPWLGGVVSGDRYAYRYLPQSTQAFKTPAELARMMRAAGLVDVFYQQRMFNTVTIIYGRVPEADSEDDDRVGRQERI